MLWVKCSVLTGSFPSTLSGSVLAVHPVGMIGGRREGNRWLKLSNAHLLFLI